MADVKAGLTGGIRAQLPHLLVIGLRPPAGNKYNLNRCQIQYKARLKGQHQQVFNTPPPFFSRKTGPSGHFKHSNIVINISSDFAELIKLGVYYTGKYKLNFKKTFFFYKECII